MFINDVTSTRAWVEYHRGDFKHDPKQVLAQYFDAFLSCPFPGRAVSLAAHLGALGLMSGLGPRRGAHPHRRRLRTEKTTNAKTIW